MKNLYIKSTIVFVVSALLISCADRFPAGYILELPDVPVQWVSLLGEPDWRVEWLDPGGQKQIKDLSSKSGAAKMALEIEIPVTRANPVTAWPYWENHGIIPGYFKPAGAIFPYDVRIAKTTFNDRLCLSWEAGADTVYFWEMIFAAGQDESIKPENFDWPRFRELFSEGTLSEEVCKDPWLVDWRFVAEKTTASGFDRRRIIPEAVINKNIPVPAGSWYGTSPFAKPLIFEEGKPSIFPVRSGINFWISGEGILRVNGDVWVLNKIPAKNEE